MDEDAEKTNEFYDMYRQTKDKWDNSVKQIVKSIVPEKKNKKNEADCKYIKGKRMKQRNLKIDQLKCLSAFWLYMYIVLLQEL